MLAEKGGIDKTLAGILNDVDETLVDTNPNNISNKIMGKLKGFRGIINYFIKYISISNVALEEARDYSKYLSKLISSQN